MIAFGAFLLVTLAVARVTRLTTTDRIPGTKIRRWVTNRFGEDAEITYLVHCDWCASMWIALPAALVWAPLTLPLYYWWLAIPAWLAMSYLTGLLVRLEER